MLLIYVSPVCYSGPNREHPKMLPSYLRALGDTYSSKHCGRFEVLTAVTMNITYLLRSDVMEPGTKFTDVSQEHTSSIFRVTACFFARCLAYLQS
jgi:hypothetical protein